MNVVWKEPQIFGGGSHCGETSPMAPGIPLPLGRRLKRKVEVGRVSDSKQLNMGFIHSFCSEQLRVLRTDEKKREKLN